MALLLLLLLLAVCNPPPDVEFGNDDEGFRCDGSRDVSEQTHVKSSSQQVESSIVENLREII